MSCRMPHTPGGTPALFLFALLVFAASDRVVADSRNGPHRGEAHADSSTETERDRSNLRQATRIDRVLLSTDTIEALERATATLETVVASGGWPRIEEGPPLRKGEADARLSSLVRRLRLSGDLAEYTPGSETFDGRIETAVRRFQHRHGLRPTGIVERRTRSAMNVSAPMRLQQIRLNLERLRALVAETGAGAVSGRHVVVNIPAFEMQAVAGGRIAVTSRVVVGKADTPTPMLAVPLTALNFFPYWHVPQSIVVHDVLPKFLRDPGYLKKTKIRVYRHWKEIDPATIDWTGAQVRRHVFRQDPGRSNALGFVRFDMPNRHTVYMHDSPEKLFFHFSKRARSAGCVRVEKARELTNWLLENEPEWSEAKIDATISRKHSEKVRLSNPVIVHFIYLTAWPAVDGIVNFREDIYGQDDLGQGVANYEGISEPAQTWNVSNDRAAHQTRD